MKQIVGDSSAYYLIGYNSTEAPTDGKFHEIKVRVKRSATQVRARRGYWAFTTADVVRAVTPPKPGPPKPLEAALAAIGYPSRARLIRTWIGTERGENGKTRVTFVWEPVPRPPGSPSRSSDQPVRVLLTAAGPDGAPVLPRSRSPRPSQARQRRPHASPSTRRQAPCSFVCRSRGLIRTCSTRRRATSQFQT